MDATILASRLRKLAEEKRGIEDKPGVSKAKAAAKVCATKGVSKSASPVKVDLTAILTKALAKAAPSREAFGCRAYSQGDKVAKAQGASSAVLMVE